MQCANTGRQARRQLNVNVSQEKEMNHEYSKIEEAYEFVSAGELFSHNALVDIRTGEVLFQSDSEELDEFPENIDRDRYIAIPTRAELHLGKPVVISFVETYMPNDIVEVHRIFVHKGAYSNFKNLLDLNNMLDQWYEYERTETERALREWCQGMGISLLG